MENEKDNFNLEMRNNNVEQSMHSEMWQKIESSAMLLYSCSTVRLTSGPSLQTVSLHFPLDK